MAEAILEIQGLCAGYGETIVLEDVALRLEAGASLSVIGRNGVGKTTLISTIMGHTTHKAGTIRLAGQALEALKPHARARLGLGLVPQEREIFPSLTVRENLEVAVRPGEWSIERVLDLFPSLANRLGNKGNRLSGGEQQMLAMARALVGNPRVLLLDEPLEGLAPVIVEQLLRVLAELRDMGQLAIVLVEQNAGLALEFSPHLLVMDRGRVVFDGPSRELAQDHDRLNRLIGVGQG